jgi:hypothetical protein
LVGCLWDPFRLFISRSDIRTIFWCSQVSPHINVLCSNIEHACVQCRGVACQMYICSGQWGRSLNKLGRGRSLVKQMSTWVNVSRGLLVECTYIHTVHRGICQTYICMVQGSCSSNVHIYEVVGVALQTNRAGGSLIEGMSTPVRHSSRVGTYVPCSGSLIKHTGQGSLVKHNVWGRVALRIYI